MQKHIVMSTALEEFGDSGMRQAPCSQYLKGKYKSPSGAMLEQAMLTPLLDEATNEYYLFHGTSWQTVDILVDTGYDSRVARVSGMFGGGFYLAECSSKSNQYIPCPRCGQGAIFCTSRCKCSEREQEEKSTA